MTDVVLVTGATGLLGSRIVNRLVHAGNSVRILRRPNSKLDLLGESADAVEHALGDITERVSVEEAMRGVAHVYHVAARIGYGIRSEDEQLLRTNVEGTALIVDTAVEAGVKRLVYTSSVAALGKPENPLGIITEQTEWQESPVNSTYGRSKYLAELEIHRGIAEGLDAVIVNPSLIFGAGRAGDNTREVVDRVRNRTLPGIPVGGNMVADVDDVADGHLRAMAVGQTGRRYILGSENLSWKEIIYAIADAFEVAPPRLMLNPRLGMVMAVIVEGAARVFRIDPLITRANIRQSARTYRYDNARAREELGCTFRPFRETVRRIASEIRSGEMPSSGST